ncbi:hypothetical protein G210_1242 [Candida maltosa Xu316]|uniref:Uncharacterized protein n=1 Tax=Candida maltosa (strain Xu316) TaxID=1245528 RepID=M3JYZ0_CANMX|nr:hypothetical protein G210_1242 [Candida maltosa Xu316]
MSYHHHHQINQVHRGGSGEYPKESDIVEISSFD